MSSKRLVQEIDVVINGFPEWFIHLPAVREKFLGGVLKVEVLIASGNF